jgi:hypothetical protein
MDREATPISSPFHFGGAAGGGRALEAYNNFDCWRGALDRERACVLFAYTISLFVTHWLFVAVKPKLLTLPWFARTWARVITVRNKTWCWIPTPAKLIALILGSEGRQQ